MREVCSCVTQRFPDGVSICAVKARKWLDEAETSIRVAARTASESAPPTRIEYPNKNAENALVYIGGILDQQRAGVGVLTHTNGCRYIGEFMSDKKHGMGVEEYADASYYKGQFNFGNRHGWGEYFDAKSQRMYRGGWVNGFRHGHGWERAVLNMVSPSRSARERKSACALLGRCTATVWPMLDGLCSGLMV
jgi:hypothetical protein